MDRNDWYSHFKDAPSLTIEEFPVIRRRDKAFFQLLDQASRSGAVILDAGCGPSKRMLCYASDSDVSLLLVDYNRRILELAKRNADSVGAPRVAFLDMDFFKLKRYCLDQECDVMTHHGVLEHYEEPEIRDILEIQLAIARRVVFSVVLGTDANRRLFMNDNISRNYWDADYWIGNILKPFKIVAQESVTTTKDELLVCLESSR